MSARGRESKTTSITRSDVTAFFSRVGLRIVSIKWQSKNAKKKRENEASYERRIRDPTI
jgi:hypothetical protein